VGEGLKAASWQRGVIAVAILLGVVVGIRMLIAWTPAAPTGVVSTRETPEVPASAQAMRSEATRPLATPGGTNVESRSPRASDRVDDSPPEGIHAFPPLGSRQLLSGIIVPDDFELPPGYVRHRQMTDTGELLPPILMFHPHEQPMDWRGEPVPVTADRVVPPTLAPEGMPVELLDAPRSGPPGSNLSRFLERN
jgi:hypothetical protein